MSDELMTWDEIGKIICNHELSPKAELLKIELCNFMRRSEGDDLRDGDIALLLLVIGESLLPKGDSNE